MILTGNFFLSSSSQFKGLNFGFVSGHGISPSLLLLSFLRLLIASQARKGCCANTQALRYAPPFTSTTGSLSLAAAGIRRIANTGIDIRNVGHQWRWICEKMKDGSCVSIGGEEPYPVFVTFHLVNGRRLRVKFGYGSSVSTDTKSITISNLMLGKRILALTVTHSGVVATVHTKP